MASGIGLEEDANSSYVIIRGMEKYFHTEGRPLLLQKNAVRVGMGLSKKLLEGYRGSLHMKRLVLFEYLEQLIKQMCKPLYGFNHQMVARNIYALPSEFFFFFFFLLLRSFLVHEY